MSPILEGNTGSSNTLPGPVRKIVCQSGQVVIIDPTEKPPACTVLNPDDVYEGDGKAGLRIYDVDGSRLYWESTLEGENRTDSQLVTAPDARPETDPRGEPVGPVDPAREHSDEPVETLIVENPPTQRGDSDGDSATGGTGAFEDRTVKELRATAKKNGVDLKGAKKKTDIIKRLRA